MQSKTTNFIQKKSLTMTRLGRNTKRFMKQVLLFDTVLGLEHSWVWCCNLGTSGSKLEIPGKFQEVVLEKEGGDNLGRSCEK
jgi:hypothetical protein